MSSAVAVEGFGLQHSGEGHSYRDPTSTKDAIIEQAWENRYYIGAGLLVLLLGGLYLVSASPTPDVETDPNSIEARVRGLPTPAPPLKNGAEFCSSCLLRRMVRRMGRPHSERITEFQPAADASLHAGR